MPALTPRCQQSWKELVEAAVLETDVPSGLAIGLAAAATAQSTIMDEIAWKALKSRARVRSTLLAD
jgi:hypothetical protein